MFSHLDNGRFFTFSSDNKIKSAGIWVWASACIALCLDRNHRQKSSSPGLLLNHCDIKTQ